MGEGGTSVGRAPLRRFPHLLVLTGLLLGVLAPAGITNEVFSYPDTASFAPSLALDAAGHPVVSYYHMASASLRLLHCNDPVCTGGDESIVTIEPDVFQSSLQLDADGFPVVAFTGRDDEGYGVIRVLRCNDPNCAGGDDPVNTIAGGASRFPDLPSLRLDSEGLPVIAYAHYSFDTALEVVRCDDPYCSAGSQTVTRPDAGGVGLQPSLALDSDDHPVVAYKDIDNGTVKVLHCDDPTCALGGDSITVPMSSGTASSGINPISLQLTSTGTPVVTFTAAAGGPRLLTCDDANCAGGGDTIVIPDPTIGYGSTSLQLDAADSPVMALLDGSAVLRLVRCDDPVCAAPGDTTALTDPSWTNLGGGDPSLQLDAQSRPVVAYSGWNGLALLRCDDLQCLEGTPPTLTLPDDITVPATSPAGGPATFTVSAVDADHDLLPVDCDAASGGIFPLGTTTVRCSTIDAAGLREIGQFTISVVDQGAPSLTMPSDPVVEATSPAGAAVPFHVTAADLIDPAPSVVCDPGSGSTFPLGTSTVTCTATDAAGNSHGDTLTVTVVDTAAPGLVVAQPAAAEATSPAGAIVEFTATASDLVDPAPSVACDPVSGSTFPLGATTVTCTAADATGNTATDTLTVTVQDTTGPDLVWPDPLEATSHAGATAAPTASDLVDPAPTVVCNPTVGSTFPLGTTPTTCTATDATGNETTAGGSVAVVDTTVPELHLPGDTTLEATSPDGAPVDLTDGGDPPVAAAVRTGGPAPSGPVTAAAPGGPTVWATDVADPDPDVACDAPSMLALGTTLVTCAARDHADNNVVGTFAITVVDTTAPVLSVPAGVTAETEAPGGAVVHYAVSGADAVDTAVAVACQPRSGALFPAGTTTVRCTATDDAGNGSTAGFPVTVALRTAAIGSPGPGPDVLAAAPADHRLPATGADPRGALVGALLVWGALAARRRPGTS